MKETIDRISTRTLWAGVLTFLSLFILILLAYRSASTHPPTESEAALLAVLSALSQLGSTLVSGWHTGSNCDRAHADPLFVKSAVARVVSIGIQAQEAEWQAQKARESGTAHEYRAALGMLSVMMSTLQEQTRAAVEDWNNLAPQAVEKLIQEGRQTPTNAAVPQGVSNA